MRPDVPQVSDLDGISVLLRAMARLVGPVAPGAGDVFQAFPCLKRAVPPDEKDGVASGPPARLAPDFCAGTEDQKLRWN